MISPENILVIIEDKARANYRLGVESISLRQQKRIIKGTLLIQSHNLSFPKDVRFDVAVVTPEKIWHIKNAWSCEEF
jgi:Holliday junction resolvase-like predicted endonuclease